MAKNKNTGIIIAVVAGALLMSCCCCPLGYGFIRRDNSSEKDLSELPTQAAIETTEPTTTIEPIAVYSIPGQGESEWSEELILNANTDTPVKSYVHKLPSGRYIADSINPGDEVTFNVVNAVPKVNKNAPYPESLDTVMYYTVNGGYNSTVGDWTTSKGTVEFELLPFQRIHILSTKEGIKLSLIEEKYVPTEPSTEAVEPPVISVVGIKQVLAKDSPIPIALPDDTNLLFLTYRVSNVSDKDIVLNESFCDRVSQNGTELAFVTWGDIDAATATIAPDSSAECDIVYVLPDSEAPLYIKFYDPEMTEVYFEANYNLK